MRDAIQSDQQPGGLLALERVPLESLQPDPSNARVHDDRNIEAIAASLQRFGQRKPIVVDADGIVRAGNGTVEAARRLGWTHIDIARTTLRGEAAMEFALADNRSAELAEWDLERLATQLGAIGEEGAAALGWDAKELASVMGARDLPEDEPPPLPPEPITKPGDLIRLGQHRLLCGSSTSKDAMAQLLDGEAISCVVTDPPYNVAYEGKTEDRLTIQNDAMKPEAFAGFLAFAFSRMFEACRAGAPIYVFHADSTGEVFRREFTAAGFALKQCLVWVKDAFVMGRQDYHWQHEPILYGWKPGAAHRWFGARNKSTVLDDDPEGKALPAGGTEAMLQELRECTTALREPRPRHRARLVATAIRRRSAASGQRAPRRPKWRRGAAPPNYESSNPVIPIAESTRIGHSLAALSRGRESIRQPDTRRPLPPTSGSTSRCHA